MKRKDTREEAVKMVYSMDVNKEFSMEAMNRYLTYFEDEFELEDIDREYLDKTLMDIIKNEDAINTFVMDNSKGWKLSRIAKVDLAILRVALAEILYNDSIPESVSINEAVEISKKYSNEDAHKFINGILGTVVRSIGK